MSSCCNTNNRPCTPIVASTIVNVVPTTVVIADLESETLAVLNPNFTEAYKKNLKFLALELTDSSFLNTANVVRVNLTGLMVQEVVNVQIITHSTNAILFGTPGGTFSVFILMI